MAYRDCPNCARRLTVPDTNQPMVLRCPACSHVFRSGPTGPGGGGADDKPAQENELVSTDVNARQDSILSKADEAMLRDLGAGSGLLELTRESFEVAVSGRATGRTRTAAAAEPLGQAAPAVKEHPDRQFQIIGTALTLANKLVLAYKADMDRARRSALLGWVTVGVLVAASGLLLWWGTNRAGQVETARAIASLGSARATGDEQQAVREALAEGKTVKVLTQSLESANARLAALTAELEKAKVAAAPTSQPASTAPSPP